MAIDYQTEKQRLDSYTPGESGEYWSPVANQYKVTAKSEIEEAEPFEDDEDAKPRAKIKIDVDGKELIWSFSVGKTLASTYGQLINLANAKGGKLTEAEFTVVVTGEDRNKRFTIVL